MLKTPISADTAASQSLPNQLFNDQVVKAPPVLAGVLASCDSGLPLFSNYEFNPLSLTLEKVIVIGQASRLDGWVTICRNSACADVIMGIRNAATRLQQVGLKESAGKLLKAFFPNPTVSACAPRPSWIERGDEAHPQNATSRSDEITRRRAAGDMIFSSRLYTNTVTVYEIDVVYSDGGTETYKYSPLSPTVPATVANSLVTGDGKSKCP